MNADTIPPRLLLTPEDASLGLSEAMLIERLRQLEFLADPFSFRGQTHYALGPRFTAMVSFVGCMPFQVLDPSVGVAGNGHGFMHARIECLSAPLLRHAERVKPPLCAGCNKPIREWRDALENALVCPSCGAPNDCQSLGWRNDAGFARVFIEIWGVERLEGVPGPGFLQSLAEIAAISRLPQTPPPTAPNWRYFYL